MQSWDAYCQKVANLQLPDIAKLPPFSFPMQLAAPVNRADALHTPVSPDETLDWLKILQNGHATGVHGL